MALMPYINKKDRQFYQLPAEVRLSLSTPGHLNYLLTQVILAYLGNVPINYQAYNDCIGALESCKLELYRRLIIPYENKKIEENSDVYPNEVSK